MTTRERLESELRDLGARRTRRLAGSTIHPEVLFEEIVAAPDWAADTRSQQKPAPPLRRRRFAIAIAAAGILVALASALLPSSSEVSGPGGSSSGEIPGVISRPLEAFGTERTFASAPAALDAAAKVASSKPALTPAKGGYAYYKTLDVHANQDEQSRSPWWNYYGRTIEERWTAADRSGRVHDKTLPPKFATPRDRERWLAAGSPDLGFEAAQDNGSRLFKPGEQPLIFTRAVLGLRPRSKPLPTDPAKLARLFDRTNIYSSADEPNPTATFTYASIILTHPGAPPKLRAAVYKVVSRVKGVQLLGRVRDPLGRVGTGVSVVSGSDERPAVKVRYTLIFDTDSSKFLAYTKEFTDERRNLPISYTALVESGHVDRLHERP